MGSLLSINMEASYKKNQAFFDEMMSKTMERQLQAQNAMLERQKAIAIAGSRELFNWVAAFYITAVTGIITGSRQTRKPALVIPIVPLTFVVTYYWDLAYGTKLDRIRLDAEKVFVEERERLGVPYGLPTPQAVERSLRTPEELMQDTHKQLLAARKLKFDPYYQVEDQKKDV